MKLTGFGALACAAALTIACAGDSRNARETDANRSAAGTTGAYGNDDDAGLDAREGAPPRIGESATGTTGQAQGSHGATGDARHFVETAAERGAAEVQLGQLATERAQSDEVKEFAQMMVRDHTRASNELQQAVSGQNIDIAKPELEQKHQQLMSRLRTLRGAEFDREYMKAMVEGHMEVRGLLQSRVGSRQTDVSAEARTHGGANPTGTAGTTAGGNTQLDVAANQWASKALPSVEQHLQKAQQIHSKLGSTTASPR